MIYATCSSYVLGQVFSPLEAQALMLKAIADPSVTPPVHAIEPLRWLRDYDEVAYSVSGGGTYISKTRCRQFHAAYESPAKLWATFDDDITMTKETLGWLVQLANVSAPTVALAPYAQRGSAVASVAWNAILVERTLPGGGKARRANGGGFGAVVMNRAAMSAIRSNCPFFRDDDGERKPAPFAEIFDRERWYGEDLSFFQRVPAIVDVWALVTGQTTHAGATINLADIPSH